MNVMFSMTEVSETMVAAMKDAMGIWYSLLFNLIGVVAIVLQFASFQMKNRTLIIIVTIASSIGWMIYFVMQGDFTSFIVGFIGVVRNIVFMLREKHKWANSKAWLYIFLFVSVAASLFTFRVWKDIFPAAASLFSIIAYYMIDENKLRKISLITFTLWVANSVSKLYYVAAIADITALISLLISLYRYKKPKEKVDLKEMDSEPQMAE